MDGTQFDALLRSLGRSRRSLCGGALVTLTGLLAAAGADAKKRQHKHKKRKKVQPPEPNSFGCLEVGDPCTSEEQCCSGVCDGKKGKKTCKAHDTGDCPGRVLSDTCGDGETISCNTSSGVQGRCETTTGGAPYCAGGGDCFTCSKDSDCHEVCGPRSACILCPVGCGGAAGTQCVGPDRVVCPL
jgi:hypothetical protein